MSDFKGTPGEWRSVETSGGNYSIVALRDRYVVEIGHIDSEQDANLIAAAPDLLKELEETHAALCFTPDYVGSERYERNKLAIAKVLGQ